MTQPLAELAAELERERATVERELAEIGLLKRQAASEVDRHEARRVQAEERVAALQKDTRADPESVAEAHAQLLAQTRRQTMMQGQIEVLEGKQKALGRLLKRLEQLPLVLAEVEGGQDAPNGAGNSHGRAPGSSSREVMAAQEEMRRQIAREMHDGPAQSIANIALQAQIVQRLFSRDPLQAETELRQLVAMVQNALEQTKNFIFDVRPMVLDDLGLVPTLRRAAAERSRRAGQQVVFESVGADSRLPTEIESGIFRIVDDALQNLIDAQPAALVVRLDWLEGALKASVSGRPRGELDAAEKQRAAVATARRNKNMPAALASMIHEQEGRPARGISDRAWSEIRERAEPVGIAVTLSDDGWAVEARVDRQR